MATPVGQQAWRELIDQLIEQRRRLAAADDLYRPLTLPKPGATAAELRAAEERLGHPLDPHYREFLTVANGWDEYFLGSGLLGTDDLGAGDRWFAAEETLQIFMENSSGVLAADLGIPDDPAVCQSIGDNDNGYASHLYLLLQDTPGGPAGGVFPLDIGSDTIWPDLYSYLSYELPQLRAFADSAELGPHSDTWGRDIRKDPPSMADIVAKIAELSALAFPEHPVVLEMGASEAELDELDSAVAGALHPEHRELLSITDGMISSPWGLGEVLSTGQLLDGGRWREILVAAQESEDEAFRMLLHGMRAGGHPDPEPKAPVLQRIGRIPAIPFAILGVRPFGVDTRDGFVRSLLDDSTVAGPRDGHTTAAGTVREHLLKACDSLWWQTRIRAD